MIMRRLFLNLSKKNIPVAYWLKFTCERNTHKKSVDKSMVQSLERLALVDFSTEAAISRLEKSIEFADVLMEVNTESVEPLISTVYGMNENIRPDVAVEESNRENLMKIAPVNEEFYYVAPLDARWHHILQSRKKARHRKQAIQSEVPLLNDGPVPVLKKFEVHFLKSNMNHRETILRDKVFL